MKRRLFMAGLAGLLVSPSLPAVTTRRARIGLLAPLTGPYKSLGKAVVDAARMAAKEQSADLVVEDTLGEPEGALKAVDRLIIAGVDVAIGPVGKRESVAAIGWCVRKNLPVISLCSDPGFEAGPTVLTWRLTPAAQGAQLAGLLSGNRAAVLYPDNEYGREAAEGFRLAWMRANREFARMVPYAEDKPDFRRSLDALTGTRAFIGVDGQLGDKKADKLGFVTTGRPRDVDFDTLFIPDFHQRIARILAYLPTVGIQNGDGGTGKAVQLSGLAGWRGKTMELTGAQAAGALILDTFGGVDDGGRAEEFERAFEASTGRIPTSFEAEVFDAVWYAAQRLSQPHDQVLGALVSGLPWEGIAGRVSAGSAGYTRQGRLFRFDVDGRVIPVD